MTGLAADTPYQVVIYHKSDASAGGMTCKIGSWTQASTGMSYANDTRQNGGAWLGSSEAYMAGTPITVTYDNFAVYSGDSR
jgi:hypothetical protein